MEPAQTRRPRPQVQRKRPSAKDYLGTGQHSVEFLPKMFRRRTLRKVSFDGPARPCFRDLNIEPATCIDNSNPRIDCGNTAQVIRHNRNNHQHFNVTCCHWMTAYLLKLIPASAAQDLSRGTCEIR